MKTYQDYKKEKEWDPENNGYGEEYFTGGEPCEHLKSVGDTHIFRRKSDGVEFGVQDNEVYSVFISEDDLNELLLESVEEEA